MLTKNSLKNGGSFDVSNYGGRKKRKKGGIVGGQRAHLDPALGGKRFSALQPIDKISRHCKNIG